jgi:acyl transferase domain-containing protein
MTSGNGARDALAVRMKALVAVLEGDSAADLRKARRRVRELETRDSEPIAIVGMGCRFPGGAGPRKSCGNCSQRAPTRFPRSRTDRGWDIGELDGHAGSAAMRQGGFVYDATEFDADFFGISPREALVMDPQQRVLLEVSWEALERAGIDPNACAARPPGCSPAPPPPGTAWTRWRSGRTGYLLTGTATSVISGRVAYTLGLEGRR